MRQQALIPSGCQQWVRQPVAVHGNRFAVASSLAIYVHSADDFSLLKILAQHNRQLTAVCWSPVDACLLACATNQQTVKIYNVESETVAHSLEVIIKEPIHKLRWSNHDENVLLVVVGTNVGSWAYKEGKWLVLHNFRSNITAMQQSCTEPRLLAVACADGSVYLYDLLTNKVLHTVRLADAVVACDVQFDPLSKQYLLVVCRNGTLSLYDTQTMTEVFGLAKQPAAERMAAFVPSAPGNFVTISNKSGVVQLWNVSQTQPLKLLKTGQSAAQSVQFFPGTSRAVITFQEGLTMVYDISKQEPVWTSQPGHTETIFACAFAPHDANMLATCSYDSSVRVWDVGSLKCIKTLVGASGILYSVCWSPDGARLAASSNTGTIYMYDYAKATVVRKWQMHEGISLMVAWNEHEPALLASASLDGTLVAFKSDGTKLKTLKHSSGVCHCAWRPSSTYLIASTTEAGNIHIWDVNKVGSEAACQERMLMGHAKKVFGVEWSPLLPHLLLSGSDDRTARVWDADTGDCLALLEGHTQEVRALCWHPEIPYLLFTGSWDSSIRAWDWRSGSCLFVSHDHHADVYGLSIHPARPFVLASTSRDTTVRLWGLGGLVPALAARAALLGEIPRGEAAQVCKRPAADGKADVTKPHTHHPQQQQPLLCGTASAELCKQLAQLPAHDHIARAALISAVFAMPGAPSSMWALAAAAEASLAGKHVKAIPGEGSMQHVAAARMALLSRANQLELMAGGKGRAGVGGMGGAKKEDMLREALLLHLQAGNLEQSCELLVQLGEWDRALALAPAVSQDYWCALLQRHADSSAKEGASAVELMPLLVATGRVGPLVELLLAGRQYDLAANVAAVQSTGGYSHLSTAQAPQPGTPGPGRPPALSTTFSTAGESPVLCHPAASMPAPLVSPVMSAGSAHDASSPSPTRRRALPPIKSGGGAAAAGTTAAGATATGITAAGTAEAGAAAAPGTPDAAAAAPKAAPAAAPQPAAGAAVAGAAASAEAAAVKGVTSDIPRADAAPVEKAPAVQASEGSASPAKAATTAPPVPAAATPPAAPSGTPAALKASQVTAASAEAKPAASAEPGATSCATQPDKSAAAKQAWPDPAASAAAAAPPPPPQSPVPPSLARADKPADAASNKADASQPAAAVSKPFDKPAPAAADGISPAAPAAATQHPQPAKPAAEANRTTAKAEELPAASHGDGAAVLAAGKVLAPAPASQATKSGSTTTDAAIHGATATQAPHPNKADASSSKGTGSSDSSSSGATATSNTTSSSVPAAPPASSASMKRRAAAASMGDVGALLPPGLMPPAAAPAGKQHDVLAAAQVRSVRRTQAQAYRLQGQPFQAACCHLSVDDVAGAVTCLTLGHEPEQATMLALALGAPAEVLGRALQALAHRCEAAGDVALAAAALRKLPPGGERAVQLLAVRAAREGSRSGGGGSTSSSGGAVANQSNGGSAVGGGVLVGPGVSKEGPTQGPANEGSQGPSKGTAGEGAIGHAAKAAAGVGAGVAATTSARRAELYGKLGLKAPSHYAAAAVAAGSTEEERVRYMLLAGDHEGAARQAIEAVKPLLAKRPAPVEQLGPWLDCLCSVAPPVLPVWLWEQVFGACLYVAALRAFQLSFYKVGSFLMSSMRRWLEQHAAVAAALPLSRELLLLEEARWLEAPDPDTACALLVAAADMAGGAKDVQSEARKRLEPFPKPPTMTPADVAAAAVVVSAARLPCKPPAGGYARRSVVSGAPIQGPWVLLDDGISVVSLSEGVMLAQCGLRFGPMGTGRLF